MRSGRIGGIAAVAGLFASIVGAGAYAIVSLAPETEFAAPPKGTFLQDPGPDAASGFRPLTQDEAGPSVERPPQTAEGRDPGAAVAPRKARLADRPERATGMAATTGDAERPASAVEHPISRRPQRIAAAPPPLAPPRAAAPQPAIAPTPRAVDPRLANVLTPSEIRRLKYSLRLTPDQEPHWPPVEAVLAGIGAEQMRLARSGQNPADAFNSNTSMRIYWAAKPLLGTMREDQKAQIRVRARGMGLESVASYL